jgi:hypothetical protein
MNRNITAAEKNQQHYREGISPHAGFCIETRKIRVSINFLTREQTGFLKPVVNAMLCRIALQKVQD